MIKLTIAIPAYNAEKTLALSIKSAKKQVYPHKEIIVLDDGSTDKTGDIASAHGVRVRHNRKNKGIGIALAELMSHAEGKYIVYLCADDIFADPNVCSDIVRQFDLGDPAVGVIGRTYYEFIDGKDGVVGVFRDQNILTSSVNPSGMAFRVDPTIKGTNDVFIEMPYIVKQYLQKWRWTMLDYDSIAVRIHPGGNTGTKESYYKGSAVENWHNKIGIKVKYYEQFVQLKCRAPKMVWREIKSSAKINDRALWEGKFWLYAITALFLPGFLLRWLAHIRRDVFGREKYEVIRRVA